MNKKLEDKILEEIRKRVLEVDKELNKRKEEKSIREATKDALAEMTSLSRDEVENIAKKVRNDVLEKRKKRRIWIAIVIICLFIVGLIEILPALKPKYRFVEHFDDNHNGWDIFNDFAYDRKINDGKYFIETTKDKWCYWDYIPIALPESYTIELRSIWQSGTYNDFGLGLFQDNDNYLAFRLGADGTVSYGEIFNDEWVVTDTWKHNMANKNKEPNIQQVIVESNILTYNVNGQEYRKANISRYNLSEIGLRVCDKQKVAFDNLRVMDNKTGELILDEPFDNSANGWTEKRKINKESHFENGKYVFSCDVEDYCYYSSIPIDFQGENYDVSMKSTWQNGETANFGIMLIENDEDFFSFQINNKGEARVVKRYNGKYTYIGNYKATGFESNGENSVEQRIEVRNDEVKYYIGTTLIDKRSISYFRLQELGVRVCGRQTVAFDEIVLSETD